MSERRACSLIGADRSTVRYRHRRPDDRELREVLRGAAETHRRFGYAEALARETGQPAYAPAKLIVPMIERFMATDRGFAKARRSETPSSRTAGRK
jgi:hypothetical protein